MEPRLGLIDYGMGNLHSVQLAFNRMGKPLKTVSHPSHLSLCDALVLPGVGSFDPAMKQLFETGLVPYLKLWAKQNRPLLGICLGLQLLFESSDEGKSRGLGLFKGNVQRLPSDQGERVPHMGWASLNQLKPCPLFENEIEKKWMYFVHSFFALPQEDRDLAATTDFGNIQVAAMVWKGRIGACQFHPEKSSLDGQRMLENWLKWLNSGAHPVP